MFDDLEDGRRGFLKCMAWAGTGALFAFSGGIGSSIGLDAALAAPAKHAPIQPFTFAQVRRRDPRRHQRSSPASPCLDEKKAAVGIATE
jgi:hypothetical protein